MHQNTARKATAKAVRIDPRPLLAITATSILATLLMACLLVF